MAPGQRQFWYPWPYVEAVTISEAVNELAFLVTGAYGKPLPFQNGAPLRLALPWKYGFKSIKSIVRFTFTDKRPVTFWERQEPQAYGFWANVNPDVPHPRWSQAFERVSAPMSGIGLEFGMVMVSLSPISMPIWKGSICSGDALPHAQGDAMRVR